MKNHLNNYTNKNNLLKLQYHLLSLLLIIICLIDVGNIYLAIRSHFIFIFHYSVLYTVQNIATKQVNTATIINKLTNRN